MTNAVSSPQVPAPACGSKSLTPQPRAQVFEFWGASMTGTQPSACALRREVRQMQRKKRDQRHPLVTRVLKKQGLQRALLAVWALSEQDLVAARKFLEPREFLRPGDVHRALGWQTLSAGNG